MSADFRSFVVSEPALIKASALSIGGDVAARVARMAKRSAPYTHPAGNRRFEDFVLTIDGNVVTDIERIA